MHPAFDLPFKRYAERSQCRDDGGSQPDSRLLQQAPVSYSASGSATTQLNIWANLVATLQGFRSNHLTLTLTPRHDHLEEATVPSASTARARARQGSSGERLYLTHCFMLDLRRFADRAYFVRHRSPLAIPCRYKWG